MHHALHPDDERLAAYAGGDADALSDRELVAHLTACDRCGPMVDELTLLRGALAALPDLAPSRPLRLIPPVPVPAAPRVGPLEWLRRLAAPAMAAGAGLVLIGAVGASGLVGELSGQAADGTSLHLASDSNGAAAPIAGGGARSPLPAAATDSAEHTSQSGEPRSQGSASAESPAPAVKGDVDQPGVVSRHVAEQPWLTLLIAGFALFGVSAALRYSLAPRAG